MSNENLLDCVLIHNYRTHLTSSLVDSIIDNVLTTAPFEFSKECIKEEFTRVFNEYTKAYVFATLEDAKIHAYGKDLKLF